MPEQKARIIYLHHIGGDGESGEPLACVYRNEEDTAFIFEDLAKGHAYDHFATSDDAVQAAWKLLEDGILPLVKPVL